MKEQLALLLRLYRLPGSRVVRHSVLAVLAGFAMVLQNLVMARALQATFAAVTDGTLHTLLLGVAVFALLLCGFFLYNALLWGWFGASTIRQTGAIRRALFAHLCALPAPVVERGHGAAVLTLFTADVAAAENAYSSLLRFMAGAVLSGLVATVLLLAKSPLLGGIILVTGLAQLACNLWAVRPLQALSGRIARQIEESTVTLQNLLDGNVTIRLYGMEEAILGVYAAKSRELQSLQRRRGLVEGVIKGGNIVLGMASYLLILGVGAWMAAAHRLTVGDLLFLTQVRGLVMVTVFTLGDFAQTTQPALASARRMFAFLDNPPERLDDGRDA